MRRGGPAAGYALFRSELPAACHAGVLAELRELVWQCGGEGVPHELVPSGILDDAAVRQAVAEMLGPSAVPDACRHLHLNNRPEPGDWHRDDYCGSPWPPGRWALLFYLPQDTPSEMGPPSVLVDGRKIITASGPAGTCLLMRHDLVHRAGGNRTGRQRAMLKFLWRAPA